MTQTTTFDDGWYAVFPEGGCYEAYEIRDDQIVDLVSQSEAVSHRNGSNWHYIPIHDAIDAMGEDDLGDTFESEDKHHEFVRLIDDDWDPSCVHVCKLAI